MSLHLLVHAGVVILPVHICIGIGLRGLYFKEVGIGHFGYFLGIPLGGARIRKISYEDFLPHVVVLHIAFLYFALAAYYNEQQCKDD